MLGILGGTFDPVHNGHLTLARRVYSTFNLSELRFLPCGQHAFTKKIHASKTQRLAMLSLALKNEPDFKIDHQEIDREGPSYAIDTLKNIRAEVGTQKSICWVIGTDVFSSLPQWKEWKNLLDHCHFIIISRDSEKTAYTEELLNFIAQHETKNRRNLETSVAGKIFFFSMPLVPVSSTEIRDKLSKKQLPKEELSVNVLDYILENNLYGP